MLRKASYNEGDVRAPRFGSQLRRVNQADVVRARRLMRDTPKWE